MSLTSEFDRGYGVGLATRECVFQLRATRDDLLAALRLVVRELDYVISTPLTAGDLASARNVLAKARQVLEHGGTP